MIVDIITMLESLNFFTNLYSAELPINNFTGGMFTKFQPDMIPDNCVQDISNFYIDDDYGLIKRRGYSKDNTVYFASAPIRNAARPRAGLLQNQRTARWLP